MSLVQNLVFRCNPEFSAQLRRRAGDKELLRQIVKGAFENRYCVLSIQLIDTGVSVRFKICFVCDLSSDPSFPSNILDVIKYIDEHVQENWGDVDYGFCSNDMADWLDDRYLAHR